MSCYPPSCIQHEYSEYDSIRVHGGCDGIRGIRGTDLVTQVVVHVGPIALCVQDDSKELHWYKAGGAAKSTRAYRLFGVCESVGVCVCQLQCGHTDLPPLSYLQQDG